MGLRIGVDACCLANGRGYGRFTREVLRHMPNLAREDEFVCFADAVAARQLADSAENVRTVVVAQNASPTQAASADGRRSVGDMLRFTRAVARARVDVFFSPSAYTYFPLPVGLPAVVTLHDTIAERFPELTLPTRQARLFWRSKVRLAIWQARLILTVSDFSAQELSAVLKIPRQRIRVAGEAAAAAYRPSGSEDEVKAAAARIGIPAGAGWFIYVGGFNPHKRLDVLVRAHGALAAELGDRAPYLVLVGSAEKDGFFKNVEAIRQEIDAAGTGHLVRWPGYVADEELRHLHSGAVALVLPSECEGFGLPAVEAAACGTPVIATLQSPLPSLLRDGGVFVEPGNANALLAAMRRLMLEDGVRTRMGARARERAGALTWHKSAESVLNALHEAGDQGPRGARKAYVPEPAPAEVAI